MVACVKHITTRCGSFLCSLSASNTSIPCMWTLLVSSFIPHPYIFLISARNILINSCIFMIDINTQNFFATNYKTMNNYGHINVALKAIRAERQQVVSYSEPRNRLPDPKGLLSPRLPSHAMPKLVMRCPCKCQQHTSFYCICCKILHTQQQWLQ